ncbi:MAG: acyl-CoA-binding protein [Chloroflexota bacterium]
MTDLKTQFAQAAQDVQGLAKKPDQATLLRLYAYYKQANSGDATGKRPGFMDIAGQAKFDAWSKLKGMSKEAAMQAYIALVDQLRG